MLRVVTAPPLPVSISEARAHLRVDHTVDDVLIAGLIAAARDMCEHELQRTLTTTTYELTLDEFPAGPIALPMAPLPEGALTVGSIKYGSPEYTLSTTAYALDRGAPAVVPVSGWPSITSSPGAVRLRYTAGSTAVPAAIKAWLLLYVGQLYENRESAAIGTIVTPFDYVNRLLDPYRTWA